MSKTNKFGAILSAAKSRQVEPEPAAPPETEPVQEQQEQMAPPAIAPPTPASSETVSEPQPVTSPAAKQKGRPRGKRSDPDYEQVTAYVRRETYRKTKIALLQRGDQREFSDLVEALLNEWLNG